MPGSDNDHTTSRLSPRALSRALLARQMLLERAPLSVTAALEHLVGLQAQAPWPPYYALWSRLQDFQPDALAALLLERRAVRIALMRSTIFMVTARDGLMLRPLVQPVLDRGMQGTYGKHLQEIDRERLTAAARELVEAQPRTFKELGTLLQAQWPDRDPAALAAAVRTWVPLVQTPPRGVWGKSGQAKHTSIEAWLGAPLADEGTLEQMVLRYLAAFGPASVKDVQVWSGLTRLAAVVDRLRPQLRSFQDETGRELFDLPDAPRPDPDTPAPVRFLSQFDNVLLSHDDRTRILDEEGRKRLSIVDGALRAGVLVDGMVAGMWYIQHSRGLATLTIELLQPLPAQARAALEEEGARLLAFAEPTQQHDVQFIVGS